MKKSVVVIAVVILAVAGVSFFVARFEGGTKQTINQNQNQNEVILGDKIFFVDIADTPALQEQGLSGRQSLEGNAGMLFVFGAPDNYGFWMKDMNFPLDIIWISSNYRIIFIEKSLSPQTYPTVYYPNSPAQYVLEISAGQTDSLGVKIGDSVQILKK